MVLGFIFIGWIGGGIAAILHLGLLDGSVVGAFGLFMLAGSGSVLLTAALAALPDLRLAARAPRPDRPRLPAPPDAILADLWAVRKDGP